MKYKMPNKLMRGKISQVNTVNINKQYPLYNDYSRNTYETYAMVQGSVLGIKDICGTKFFFQLSWEINSC